MTARGRGGRGRLIAVEGPAGFLSAGAVKHLLRLVGGREARGGASFWDASAVFTELRRLNPEPGRLSPRPLILLYASDLLFRLRWEIEPALKDGQWVAAAPYVESAVAFGRATGVDEHWLRDLFEFAPAADEVYRDEWIDPVPDPHMPFLGCLAGLLAGGGGGWNQWDLNREFRAYLEELESSGRCRLLDRLPPAG